MLRGRGGLRGGRGAPGRVEEEGEREEEENLVDRLRCWLREEGESMCEADWKTSCSSIESHDACSRVERVEENCRDEMARRAGRERKQGQVEGREKVSALKRERKAAGVVMGRGEKRKQGGGERRRRRRGGGQFVGERLRKRLSVSSAVLISSVGFVSQ